VIPNVTRGGRVRGLVRYLTGEGRANEHTDPRLVAGDPALMAAFSQVQFAADRAAGRKVADQISEHLDHPRVRSGTRVTVPVKDVDGKPTGEQKDAHVWHCSLSLHPSEPGLSRDAWAQIAQEFVAQMGFGGGDGEVCRWVAIHHGLSNGGNDHVHVVVQLVAEDGRAASVHLDRPRAQRCARELERVHGLRVVEGRDRGRGMRATNTRQAKRAEREHQRDEIASGEADRELLERAVRVLSAAARDEAEFVRRVRAVGVLIRPRFAAGSDQEVVGYAVAVRAPAGKEIVWHAGGKLAKDLTLPRLRAHWPHAPAGSGASVEAAEQWRRAWRGEPAAGATDDWTGGRQVDDASWEQALEQLRELCAQLDSLPVGERGAWADVAGQGAAVFYGWAELAPEHAGALRRCGEQLARSAQLPSAQARRGRAMPQARGVAILCAALMAPGNELLYWLVLAQQLAALTQAVCDMHQAAGEAQRAALLAAAIREQLLPVHAALDDQRAAVDPSYARAREAVRLAEIARASSAPGAASERLAGAEELSDEAAEALRLARIAAPERSPLGALRPPLPDEPRRGGRPPAPPGRSPGRGR